MNYEYLDITFETPQFLILHYHITGCISIIMNSFVFYLLLYHKGKMDTFRFYLLGFQVACSICDIHLTFLMQPVTLFPVVSGHCHGVLSKLFDVYPHFLMTILSLLVGFQVNALNLCFLRKHQAIASITNKYVLSKCSYNTLVILFSTFTFTYTIPFYLSRLSIEEQYHIIEKEYSKLRPQFDRLDNFDLYKLNATMLMFFIMIIIGCIQSTFTVSIFAFQMYRILVNCSQNLSKTTLEKHKSALKSLVGQFLTTPIAILPAMLIVSIILVPFKGAQQFAWFMLMTMSTHSTINCLVVIFSFPEFRAFVLFWSKEGRLQRRKSVSFVVNSNGSSRLAGASSRISVSQT